MRCVSKETEAIQGQDSRAVGQSWTDDDVDVIAGKRDQFLGKLQERHGLAKEEAEKQLAEWHRRYPDFRFDR